VNLFFDTSALIKYFHPESGTVEVIELIENPVHQIWVSDLARIEFISALCRKLRRGDINNVQLQETLSGFDIEWAQFNHQPLSL
jgi:predicted nucleic acid-binding protein